VSKIGGVRRGNTKAISGYTRQIRSQSQAVQWQERPAARARLGETWWLGLRLLEGVDPERARRSSGLDPSSEDPALAIAARLEQQGLLRREQQRFCLSERGIPLADYVGREFLELGLGESSAPNANPARV
jgi:coproporphyrinogen III oxidase-like Fe-S oxidoreductase